ncbi:MAG: hypothetical protein HY657_05485 [Acidobacteria bacterium]|nr:hypothetical protein [Acidobacteriota bacterium]
MALWGFVDSHAFLTKAGHLGLVYRVAGADFECLDHAQRRDIVHRFEGALRLLDDSCRVYQYLYKRRIDPLTAGPCDHPIADAAIRRRVEFLNDRRRELYDIALYLVLVYEGLGRHRRMSTRLQAFWREPRRALREWLSTETTFTFVGTELDRAIARLYQKAAAFEVLLADSIRPTRLDKTQAFRFFRRLVTGDFLIGKDVGLCPAALAGQDSCGRDLRARVVRVQPGRESSDLTQAASPGGALHVDRRHGPAQRQVDGDERGPLALHELDKMTERDSGFAQLRAQRPPDRHILGQGLPHRRHRSPPVVGHGRATVRKAPNATWV